MVDYGCSYCRSTAGPASCPVHSNLNAQVNDEGPKVNIIPSNVFADVGLLQQQIVTLQAENTKIRAEVVAARELAIAFEKERDEWSKKTQQANLQAKKLSADRDAMVERLKRHSEERDHYRAECHLLRAALDKAEAAEDLRSLCSDLDAKLRAANLQNEELQKKLDLVIETVEERVAKFTETWNVTHGVGADARLDCMTKLLAKLKTFIEKRIDETLSMSGCGHVVKAKDALCPICGV